MLTVDRIVGKQGATRWLGNAAKRRAFCFAIHSHWRDLTSKLLAVKFVMPRKCSPLQRIASGFSSTNISDVTVRLAQFFPMRIL